ncbi:hypothetical protein KFE25_005164 [Diacronema lutheri]|uniref:Pyruvate phosphate dikinase AMP/ATP-binding domain-containing protein n=1 Tax=Diacronema lutheri TaxID=2081491 RepID=A0A8J6C0Y9_DIALT|nr:hypothetical protein KFE25_005164 [Diacronema lutheri]
MWAQLWRGAQRGAVAPSRRPPLALAPLARTAAAPLARALSSTAVRTVKLPPSLQSILNDFQKSKTLSRTSKSAPERMQVRVSKVLLLCSDYDSYTFEEDGMLQELMHAEYATQNLRKPPTIDRVTSVEAAMEALRTTKYDMLISLLRAQGESLNLESFVEQVKKYDATGKIPILLLALNPSELLSLDSRVDESLRFNVDKRLTWEKGGVARAEGQDALRSTWLWPFLWQGNLSLFTAMFKAVEDRLNASADTATGSPVILLVEDNVNFYSMYLPMVYAELIKQSAALEDESMTQAERLNRMMSRPKVLLCTNFEEATDIYNRYKDATMAIITDVAFSRNGQWEAEAGLDFVKHVQATKPQLDIVVQSSEPSMADRAASLGCKFLYKHSPSLALELNDFFRRTLLFGPLTFADARGADHGTATNITSLMRTYATLPDDVIDSVARTDLLSKWFRARAEPALAKHFKESRYPDDFAEYAAHGFSSEREWLRHWVVTSMFSLRNRLTGSVTDSKVSDDMTPIVRVGKGSLGGKGRGFRLLHNLMDNYDVRHALPGVEIKVPQCLILATDVFDRFVESNGLLTPSMAAEDDAQVERLFERAALPADALDALRVYAERVRKPVAVRSSSLFEDAFQQPFAGVYQSYMLHNAAPGLDERVATLASAVKKVYASVFSSEARRYAEASRLTVANEKMAVIVQQIAGKEHAPGVYAPSLAGVANAIDFYPRPTTTTDDGSATIAAGFGASVVDGLSALTWSLGDPAFAVGKPTNFKILRLGTGAAEIVGDASLEQLPIGKLGEAGLLKTLLGRSATPVVELQTRDAHGQKVVFTSRAAPARAPSPVGPAPSPVELSIEQVVRGDLLPLSQALSFWLQLGSAALACPVELEFALNLRKNASENHELVMLQIRPMPQLIPDSKSTKALRFSYLPSTQHAAVTSKHALGHGRFNGITDVVYVPPGAFSTDASAQIAREIGTVNAALRKAGKKYLLIGPGRWGTADPARGIPVSWSQIDSAQFIVESSIPSAAVAVPPSQGAHFFQNIMSFGLGYMTVDTRAGDGESAEAVDFEWLEQQPQCNVDGMALTHVRHVRLATELEVVCDGLSRRGVVMKPGKPFDVYVAQPDAMMAITAEAGGH